MWLLLAACTGGGGGGGGAATDVASLRVEPAELELVTSEGAPASATFTAIATFHDGTEKPIDLVAWTVSNASAGSVTQDGAFLSVDTNGGSTLVTATHLGIEASAQVTVVYKDEVVEGVDEALVAAFAAAAPTDDASVAFTYPADTVTVPRNLDGFSFAWNAPSSANVSRLRFRSDLSDVSVYTSGETWMSRSALWSQIAAANREGTVTAQVETGAWDGAALTDVRTGPPITLTVNRFDARGSVLYWATSSSAVLRIPFGETTAARFWPRSGDPSCIGCHTLVEDTDQMVVTHDGVNGAYTLVDIADPTTPNAVSTPSDSRRMTFKTVSPDGMYMLGVTNGTPELYALQTGAKLTTPAFGGGRYTHPDWSPDGTSVVAVRVTGQFNSDMGFTGGELVKIPFTDGAFGTPVTLVPAVSGKNLYYPAWSPDGAWIAYNRSTGDSYADGDAEVWLSTADGTRQIRLDTINDGGVQNSYPRWGPLPDDDVLWLAFSSKRDYAPSQTSFPQIWISAIDPTLAEQGLDPSFAPFWLPGQDVRSDNHLPAWWSR